MHSLYHYLKPVAKKLPDPDGPLSKSIPPSLIQAANDAYIEASGHSQSSKRGSYTQLPYTPLLRNGAKTNCK